MKRIQAVVALPCAMVLALTGCSSSDSGSGEGTQSVEQVIARWPDDLGSLDLTPQADAFVTKIQKADKTATDVQVRSMTGRGGVLGKVFGELIGAQASASRDLPDVAFLGASGGLPSTTDTAKLHETVLGSFFDGLGVSRGLAPRFASALSQHPFTGPNGLHGGYIPYRLTVRLAGFAGPETASGNEATKQGTWCAFVAHGVGVVVLGSTLTKSQDEQLAADLQK